MSGLNGIFHGGMKKHSRGDRKDEQQLQEEQNNLLSNGGNFFIREAYKTLRTNVTFALADQEGCRVVVVTSAMQSEGQSFTASNLAISYAQADKKVLLIDCDLRRPKLDRLTGLSCPYGLTNLLLNPGLWDRAILHDEKLGADVLLSGAIPPNPSELLGSKRMQALLESLRREYEYIILDTPPVNMVIDAAVVAPMSDGVIVVVRMNSTERGAVDYAVKQLEYSKAKILGLVLNDIDVGQRGYGYGRYGYGRYGYGRYGYYGYKQYGGDSANGSK
jgi:capsular exopolysaccharide synthesis family protein